MFETLQTNLIRKKYATRVFSTGADAANYLANAIRGETVAFGGSVTLEKMGLYERLSANNDVLWHWRVPQGSTAREVLRAARDARVYLCSVNAIAETGEIVNIDGNGNRVAETCFGHERVYFVVGRNKVVATLEDAIKRAREVAAPLNAKRLAPNAARLDVAKIARVAAIFDSAPLAAQYEVVLIDEDLGF